MTDPRVHDTSIVENQTTPSKLRRVEATSVDYKNNVTAIDSRTLSPPPTNNNVNRKSNNTSDQNHSRLFYSQAHGFQQQGFTVFYNQLSPGQIHNKSIQQLTYENGVLLEELNQRDQIIAMYKANWQPNQTPINDELIKNLNLQLSQKNVLIEQFHRSLAQFEETVRRNQIQLSPICMEQFSNLQTLIIRHEHYPILITQRLIETSKQAQTIYIQEKTFSQEFKIKLEESYKEVRILRQKLLWFESQFAKYQQNTVHLKQQLTICHNQINNFRQLVSKQQQQIKSQSTSSSQVTSLRQQLSISVTQINSLKQQLIVFQNENAALKQQIHTLQTSSSTSQQNIRQQLNVYVNEINNYKLQIQQLQVSVVEISNLKQQITVYVNDINGLKGQIQRLQAQNAGLVQQIQQLQQQKLTIQKTPSPQLSSLKQQISIHVTQINNYITQINSYKQQISVYVTQINNYKQQISVYVTEINNYKQQIFVLQGENSSMKQQIQQIQVGAANGNAGLVAEINGLKQQITGQINEISRLNTVIQQIQNDNSGLRIQIQNQQSAVSTASNSEMNGLKQQVNVYVTEINSYKQQINVYITQINNYKQQISVYATQINNYKQQINVYITQINNYKQQITITQNQNTSLKQQLSILQNQTTVLHQKLQHLQSSKQTSQTMTTTTQTQTIQLKKQIQYLKQQLSIYLSQGQKVDGAQINALKQQINVYITQINGKDQHISALQGEFKNLRDQLEETRYNLTQFQNLIGQYNQQASSYVLEIQGLKIQIQALKGEKVNDQQILEDMRSQLKKYSAEIAQNQVQISIYIQQTERLNDMITHLKSQTTNIQPVSVDITQYTRQISRLQNQIEQLKNKQQFSPSKANFEFQLQMLRTQNDQQRTQINTLKQKLSTYLSKEYDTQWEIDALKRENQRQKNQNLRFKGQIQELQAQNMRISQELIKMKSKLSSVDSKPVDSEWRFKYEESIKTINQLQIQIDQFILSQNSSDYDSQIQTLTLTNKELSSNLEYYRQELQASQLKIETLLNSEIQIKQLITTLQEENSQLQKIIHQLQQSGEIEILQDENQVLKQQINNLQIQVSRLKGFESDVQAYTEQISQYQGQLGIFQQEVQRLKEYIDHLKKQNQQFSSNISQYQVQIGIYNQEMERLNEIIDNLRNNPVQTVDGQYDNIIATLKSQLEESLVRQQGLERNLRSKFEAQIKEVELLIRKELEITIRSELEISIRRQLDITIRRELEIIIRRELEITIKKELSVSIKTDIESRLREELESQFNYKLTLLEERLRRQIREQLLQTLEDQVRERLKSEHERMIKQYIVKVDQGYQHLRQAEQYIELLLKKIQQLESTSTSTQQTQQTLIIQSLKSQLFSLKNQYENSQKFIVELEEQLKNAVEQSDIIKLNMTIDQLTLDVKEYIAEITELKGINLDWQNRYEVLEESSVAKIEELTLNVVRLEENIRVLKAQIQTHVQHTESWNKERKALVEKYESELKERWDQLNKAQQYIASYTKESQEIISYLEKRIRDLEQEQESSLSHISENDEFLYKLDSRYEEIKKRLVILSNQAAQSIASESEYWETYRVKRKSEVEILQQNINQSLSFMSQIDQSIVVRRDELYRLDFAKLEEILREIERIKKSKGELDSSLRKELETKFYGILRSVASTSFSTANHSKISSSQMTTHH